MKLPFAGGAQRPKTVSDPILITGCSTGLGKAIAADLLERGHVVYATARRLDTLTDLAAAGAHALALDVTDEASLQAAVDTVQAAHGRVGTLINNAGYGEYGPIEEVPIERVRTMFETNVFGLVRLTQLVLPAMRAARSGRLINMSSMGGRFTFPVGGFYHSTKYAVEAISDALRYELRGLGIDVAIIEPGLIRTNFEATMLDSVERVPADSPYARLVRTARDLSTNGYDNRLLAADPERVVAAVRHAVEAERPRTRYLITPLARLLVHSRRLLPDRAFDGIVAQQFR